MKFRLGLVCLFCAVGWSAVRANDPGVWEALGPDGASGAVVRFHPSQPEVLFAGTTAGVYRSADGGSHWSFSGRGIGITWVSALEIAPSNPRVLYAGTADRGVYRSADGGESWVAWNEGLDDFSVDALGIDPNRDDVVFLGTSVEALYRRVGEAPWQRVKAGVLPEVSGGLSFNPPPSMDADLSDLFGPLPSVGSVVVDPVDDQIVYATTRSGVLRSLDGGGTWETFEAGLTDEGESGTFITSITGPGQVVIAGTDPPSVYLGRGSIYRLNDEGEWVDTDPLGQSPSVALFVRGLEAAPSAPRVLWANMAGIGLLLTHDGGQSWRPVTAVPGTIISVTISPEDSARAVVGCENAIVQTLDEGRHWDQIDEGIRARKTPAVERDPFNPLNLHAATATGVLSRDGVQQLWRPMPGQQPSLPGVRHILTLPHARQFFATTEIGLYRTRLGSGQWQHSGLVAGAGVLAAGPSDSETVYASGFSPVSLNPTAWLLKSTDGGRSWQDIGTGFDDPANVHVGPIQIDSIVVDPSDPEVLYAGGSAGIFKSTDGGEHWKQINSGLPVATAEPPIFAAPIYLGQPVTSLAVDPDSPEVVYAGTSLKSGQLFKSTNGGDHWEEIGVDEIGKRVEDLVVDPAIAGTLYMATWGDGVLRSGDGGATWEELNEGLDSRFVYSLEAADTEPRKLLAATAAGVYRLATGNDGAAPLTFTQEVSGQLYPTGTVLLDAEIALSAQNPDRVGRFFETLPEEIRPLSADSDAGDVSIDAAGNTVLWQGQLSAGTPVHLRIRAVAEKGTEGREFMAQAALQSRDISFIGPPNETVSDDPSSPEPFDPNRFKIGLRHTLESALAVPTRTGLEDTFVGVALANGSDDLQIVTRRHLRATGATIVEEPSLLLEPDDQQAFLVEPGSDMPEILLLQSDAPVQGMFSFGSTRLERRLDTLGASLDDSTDLYIAPVSLDLPSDSYVFLFNADTSASSRVSVEWHGADGERIGLRELTLPALGSHWAGMAGLFAPAPSHASNGFLHIISERPVRGFALQADSESFSLVPAVIPRSIDARRIAHVFWDEEGGSTLLHLLNPGPVDARILLELWPDPSGIGVPGAEDSLRTEITVGPGTVQVIDLETFWPERERLEGHLRIEAVADFSPSLTIAPPLVASVEYAGGMSATRSVVSIAELAPARSFTIPQVAQGASEGVFQGLSITVPAYFSFPSGLSEFGLPVTVEAFDSRGYLSAARRITIPYGGRLVGLLDDPRLFGSGFEQNGGRLVIRSSRAVTVLSFYGGTGFLASAPATGTTGEE